VGGGAASLGRLAQEIATRTTGTRVEVIGDAKEGSDVAGGAAWIGGADDARRKRRCDLGGRRQSRREMQSRRASVTEGDTIEDREELRRHAVGVRGRRSGRETTIEELHGGEVEGCRERRLRREMRSWSGGDADVSHESIGRDVGQGEHRRCPSEGTGRQTHREPESRELKIYVPCFFSTSFFLGVEIYI
jgi:hypothetical protein